ncbi:zinc finger protein 431-like [Trichogramma pretiosum]|uniref:zinc finger protein 431-like n=1 Tax=Trichogramma pretiosum TaxID=7493 RepID=UPI0006C981B5|nr:zinc finger protein 431-like [Trichogramma pretiosum]
MEFSGLFNCPITVRDEPSDWSLRVNEPDVIDEKPDIKDVKLLSFLPENSTYRHLKCDKNHESEVKIVFECEDVKPKVDSSAVKKIEDYSKNHRQFMKYGDVYTNLKMIKIEPFNTVKKLLGEDNANKLNMNLNCDQNKKRKVKEKLTYNCGTCGKTFKRKSHLKTHVVSVHNKITYACNICTKTFTQKGSLQIHIDSIEKCVTHRKEVGVEVNPEPPRVWDSPSTDLRR